MFIFSMLSSQCKHTPWLFLWEHSKYQKPSAGSTAFSMISSHPPSAITIPPSLAQRQSCHQNTPADTHTYETADKQETTKKAVDS